MRFRYYRIILYMDKKSPVQLTQATSQTTLSDAELRFVDPGYFDIFLPLLESSLGRSPLDASPAPRLALEINSDDGRNWIELSQISLPAVLATP